MRGLLVRVGADQSEGGGWWNAPADGNTHAFAYVAIPETKPVRQGHPKPYSLVAPAVHRLGRKLPLALSSANMHLDPDFSHLTYGDQGERAKQIGSKLSKGDLLVFYAGLADIHPASRLVYAIIGVYVIAEIVVATGVPRARWGENAHTRRILAAGATDIVVRAQPEISGRLERCIPIGDFRNRAYRVTQSLLAQWGGLSVLNGYLQRSARLPELLNAPAFYAWLKAQNPRLVARNN
jgi:hypothetical protein